MGDELHSSTLGGSAGLSTPIMQHPHLGGCRGERGCLAWAVDLPACHSDQLQKREPFPAGWYIVYTTIP